LELQLAYWQKHLSGAPAVLNLPINYPRPAMQTFVGARLHLLLSNELLQELKLLSQREGVTLFMTLLAAFQVLLLRYTGQDDLVVGTPIANRTRHELEGLIGFFVNTLALRTDLSGDPSFQQLLRRVRDVALQAYVHQDVPFEKVVEALHVERSMSYSPLFQVLFILQNTPAARLELPDLVWSLREGEQTTAKFDLCLELQETEQGLLSIFEYNTDLFDKSTIQQLLQHWHTLLQEIVAHPQRSLSAFSLLTEEERQTILFAWNDTGSQIAEREQPIHSLFEAQCMRTPDVVAAIFVDQSITYAELNLRANQLAFLLMSSGVGPEVLVGLCLERSLEMLIGLLAILKVGGVCVPLDPSYPPERLAFMLQDAGLALLLTQQQFLSHLIAPPALPILCLDRPLPDLQLQPRTNPDVCIQRDHLAYVLYTSGSTGQPKGVAMRHGALANLFFWQQQCLPLASGEIVLQFAPLSFDVSFQEVFTTWQSGGTLLLLSSELWRDPQAILRLLLRHQVQRIYVPYVELQQLAQAAVDQPTSNWHLRTIVSAGEQLLLSQVIVSWLCRLEGCVLANQYGPTECHVVTAEELQGEPERWPLLPPIGRPISNTQIYLLDPFSLQPVPVGVGGELFIGGEGLARGYLHRPDLTAERFVPDPLSVRPGARLYRTGDRARYLRDGRIEYQGRFDQQVKLRGFRVELGEIEAALQDHLAVREAVVTLRDDKQTGKYLVAYVVLEIREEQPTAQQLQHFLHARLPDYMIPALFVMLERLPRTPSGKIDRRILPVPDEGQLRSEKEMVAPQTPMQEALTQIWLELLPQTHIGIHDNFFELGGHSLLATQLIVRVQRLFAVEIPVRNLFERPTIAELVLLIQHLQREKIQQIEHEDLEQLLAEVERLSDDEILASFCQEL
jgi:amino acid adenylation domain-containing protein